MVGNTGEQTPQGRTLGAELRECRDDAGLTQRELAEQLGISHVAVSRYERGTRTPKPEDVAQILGTLGVTGDRYRELVEMARNADQPNWIDTGRAGIRRELTTLMEFERSATAIVCVATGVIPGLLQTWDYARTVMGDTGNSQAHVAIRVGRRDVLSHKDPPEYWALISEAVLRDRLGGPAIMADQLRHVLKMADLPNVTIQVIPAASEQWHPAHAGSFVLFEFQKTPPIVHLEHYASAAFIYSPKDVVHAYHEAVTTLRHIAISPARSAELIATLADELEGTAP